MKPFFLLSSLLIVAMLLAGILPYIIRVSFNGSTRPDGAIRRALSPNVLSPVTSSNQLGYLPTLAPFPPAEVVMDAPQVVPGLQEFSTSLLNGQNQLVGVYVANQFALPVIQQPLGQPDFVSNEDNIITEFSLPQKYGSTGLLAHNYLSGQMFYALQPSQEVTLVYGTGLAVTFRITHLEKYQALSPNSPMSEFIELDTIQRNHLTSSQLFHRIYGQSGALILQTCIEDFGEPSWGRLFIIAEPISSMQTILPTLTPPSLN